MTVGGRGAGAREENGGRVLEFWLFTEFGTERDADAVERTRGVGAGSAFWMYSVHIFSRSAPPNLTFGSTYGDQLI